MENIAVSNVTAWDVNLHTALDDDPQLVATSHSYAISWNGVQYNDLSVGRLLMLICISRAEAMEAILQNEMEMLARDSDQLQSSVDLVECLLCGSSISNTTSFTYTDMNGSHTTTVKSYLQNVLQITYDSYPSSTWSKTDIEAIMSPIKNRQDELNTITQKTTINIKDLVTKRDKAYLLGTNALKRLMKDIESNTFNI